MKELTIEEKAKRYDEALKQIKECTPDENGFITIYPNEIFHELKESEDERIRKSIIGFLFTISSLKDGETLSNKDFDSKAILEWGVWLEKQGKNNMGISEATKQELEDNLNEALEKETPESWNEFLEKQDEQKPTWSKEDDMMFRKAIITIDNVRMDTGSQEYYQGICNWLISLKDRVQPQPKQEWSKEDVGKAALTIRYLDIAKNYQTSIGSDYIDGCIDWLKSLKDRVLPQPKQEWSEEDKNMLQSILDEYKSMPIEKRNWLKSLRPQTTWKPSELQIEALESATENCAYSEYQDCLRELIGQLKKLMEEL